MEQIYSKAMIQYGKDAGCYIPPKLAEDALGEDLRAKGFENWTYDIEHVDGSLTVRHKNIDLDMKIPEGQTTTV